MPMSPRNPSANIQPSTPTLPHTLPAPVHPPIPPPPLSHQSASLGGLAPSPSTPSSTTKTLNATSSSFVPRKAVTVSLKTPDGVALDLDNRRTAPTPTSSTTSGPAGFRQGSPGTPNRRPASIRIESEDQRKQRLAEEEEQKEKEKAKLKADEEEKIRKETEAAERKLREEEDRKRQEAEVEKERLRKAEEAERRKEEERLKKEEEERLQREAEEREARRLQEEEERRQREEEARRLAEEQARKEEEERLHKEKEERERAEREQAEQAEAKRLAEEAEKKLAEQTPDGKGNEMEEGEILEDQDTPPHTQDGRDKVRESLRIDTTTPAIGRRRHPGPLDLEEAKKSNIAGPQSALATARIISDILSVPYPEGVSSPNPALNQNAKEGKFRCVSITFRMNLFSDITIYRYDRDFLLQFMSICKEKPATLPPLDAIGIEPLDHSSLHLMRGGSGRHRTSSTVLPPSRQALIGLGFAPSTMGKGVPNSFNPMGNLGTGKLSSEDRFNASRATSVSGAAGMQFQRPMALARTASSGPSATRERTRSKRGEKRDPNKLHNTGQSQASSMALQHQQMGFEPVVPLQATTNCWDRKTFQADGDSPEMVERKIKGLLNKLTMEKFDSISNQIISWAN